MVSLFEDYSQARLGFTSKADFKAYQSLGFTSKVDFDAFKSLGFTSKVDFDACKSLGFTSKVDFDACKSLGFTSKVDFDAFKSLGFTSKADFDACKSLGFTSKADFNACKSLGFTSKADFDACKSLGFTSKADFDAYQSLGFTSKADFDAYQSLGFTSEAACAFFTATVHGKKVDASSTLDLTAVLQELEGRIVDVETPSRELSKKKETITTERDETLVKLRAIEQHLASLDKALVEVDSDIHALQGTIETQRTLRECVTVLHAQREAVRNIERQNLEARITDLEKLITSQSEALGEKEASIANALEEANAVIGEDTLKYRTGYSKYLREDKGEESGRDELEREVVAMTTGGSLGIMFVPTRTKEKTKAPFCWEKEGEDFLQPDPDGLASPKDKVKYTRYIRSAFEGTLETLDATLMAMCADVKGVHYEKGPQKKDVRLFEKARLSYKNNLRRLSNPSPIALTSLLTLTQALTLPLALSLTPDP